ncbi:hypothetical protein MUB24_15175 [Lederbergia sp. NSJ-179]|uniref:hypothetical protein n=1 Tax=Lederbergia sp. NSJ-179 TaxID=2931402 RepID=UPI001FD39DF8|nr:hypothetical protein [Lederbergia sp. NSJ-179]MCJ7842215.1 hypothetical protein [Lederbergia sp. NSJ-179]
MNLNLVSTSPLTMRRRVAPAFGLFFLSPLVAEFLLGNISISSIAAPLFFAPMYGGGAILIREITRRFHRGWPTMILLGLAYGVIEEGLITQSLFNPSYAGQELLSSTYIPALGMGAWWTLFVLTLHTVWSTSVPIALMESLVPDQRTRPWLGKIGLTVVGLLFIFGSAINFFGTYVQGFFLSTAPQLIGTLVAIIVLIVVAFAIHQSSLSITRGIAPSPRLVGIVSLVASSLFMVSNHLLHSWLTVCVCIALFTIMIIICTRWSRSEGWGESHLVALAGGALLTYAWNGFLQYPVIGAKGTVDLIGNGVFALIAIILLFLALYRVRRSN